MNVTLLSGPQGQNMKLNEIVTASVIDIRSTR